jgi:hypothetical protein
MVSFRFHLVSLTAVFLALAAGIAVGAAVVDSATVELLERQLDQVEDRRARTNGENDVLRAELNRWNDFTQQAGDQLVAGRLPDVPVLLVAVDGIERVPVEAVRRSTVAAGARLTTVWFTAKWRLTEAQHLQELAAVLGATGEEGPDALRRAALTRLTSGWISGAGGSLVNALHRAAFIDFEAPTAPVDLARLPAPGTRFLIVSSERAQVPNEQLAIPLTQLLGASGGVPLLAAEIAPPASARPNGAVPFVGSLRSDSDVSSRISTVDNLEDYRGRVAAILALELLGRGQTGHFGLRAGSQRLVPEPVP